MEELVANLQQIKLRATEFLKDRVLLKFTDHGIKHCERMLGIFKSLNITLNPIEDFIIKSAIYLHDIGMQINNETVLRQFASKYKLDMSQYDNIEDFIRCNHHLLSSYWIIENILGDKDLPKVYFGDAKLGYIIALVVESHGIDFLKDERYKNDCYQGSEIQVKLLSALLCLCDYLDCDLRRINYDKIKIAAIPLQSLLFWKTHYYIESSRICNNIIYLSFAFPELSDYEYFYYDRFFAYKIECELKQMLVAYQDLFTSINLTLQVNIEKNKYIYKDELDKNEFYFIEQNVVSEMEESKFVPMRVAIGILVKDNYVLMVQRREEEGNLKWQFPAGIVKNYQTPDERVIEELFNETNIKSRIIKCLGKRLQPDTKTICYYFALEYSGNSIKNKDKKENAVVKWISLSEYKNKITSDLYNKVSEYLEEVCKK